MDHQYWDLIREGDEQAFRTLYSLYEDRLFRYGIGIAHDEELVNNAIQTLFTYLFERRKKLSVPISLYAYLASSLAPPHPQGIGEKADGFPVDR